MPIGITNLTSVTFDNVTSLTNVTSLPEFMINVNNQVWNGYFYFIALWVFWIILFFASQQVKNEMLVNAMYSGTLVTIISFFMRAINVSRYGVVYGLLTDWQMWMFPLITIILAVIVWATKQQ